VRRHTHGQIVLESLHGVLEASDTGTVPNDPASRLARTAQRPRRRAPDCIGLLIAHKDRFAGRIGDWFVGKGSQAVFPAVSSPRVRGTRLAYHSAELGVRQNI